MAVSSAVNVYAVQENLPHAKQSPLAALQAPSFGNTSNVIIFGNASARSPDLIWKVVF